MSLLSKFEKSRLGGGVSSESVKTPINYSDRIFKAQSFALSQVESPVNPTSLTPKPGDASYTQEVFDESVN
jgi:hypothetical protein